MRSKESFNKNQVQILPFTLLPSSFPRKNFEKAKNIQVLLNELMHKAAHDNDFITKSLKRYTKFKKFHSFWVFIICYLFYFSTIHADPFTAKLFEIYETVYKEGYSQVK